MYGLIWKRYLRKAESRPRGGYIGSEFPGRVWSWISTLHKYHVGAWAVV